MIAVLTALVLLAAPASAQYEPGQPGFVLDPPVTPPDTPVEVIGSGCPAGSQVDIYVDGEYVGSTTAGNTTEGNFNYTLLAPPNAGQYTVTVGCGEITMSQILTVVVSECGFAISGSPGAPVTASVPGLAPGTTYTLLFEHTGGSTVQVGSGTATSDPQTVNFTIPSDAGAGFHKLFISGTSAAGGDALVECEVTVSIPPTTSTTVQTTTGTLPRTGTDGTTTLVQVAAGLLGAGGMVLLVSRRRREA